MAANTFFLACLRWRRPQATWVGPVALAAALCLHAPFVSAQDTTARASQFYEDALQRFDKKDYAGAVVQLKNVLKLDARNLSAQVLLARALLENDELNAAEIAFMEALRLGVNRTEIVVPMANAMLRQGKPDTVLSDARFAVEGLPRSVQFEFLLLRAAAAADLGDTKVALRAIADARTLNPNDPGSYLTEVPIRIRARELKQGLEAADRAIALAPASPESHFVRGEVLHVMADLPKARAAYDRAISLDPTHVGALVARAGILMDLGLPAEAMRNVEATLKKAPREPRALYLKALVAESEGRTADARAALNEITAQLDPIPAQYLRYRPLLQMLGGMAHHGLGQHEKAKPYLEGMLRADPAHTVAKVLATIYVADRNADAAILVLDNYLRAQPADSQARLLLANAHLSQGRPARAVQILQDALNRADQPHVRTAHGLALVGAGRFAEAIRELDAVFAKDPRNLQAGYALGSLYVQSGQSVSAMRVAQTLEKSFPDQSDVQLLLGQARRLRGDSTGAKSAFEAALRADPGQAAAHVHLARVAVESGDMNQAAKSLDAVLSRNDKHPEAIATLAEVLERTGKLAEAERWLARGDEVAGGDNPAPALALVEFHLRQGQVPKAQDALKRAQAKAPDAEPVLVMAARVAMAAGDVARARTHLGRASTAAGFNVPQLTQVAGLQMQAGAPQAAAHSLDKALNERPDHVPALTLRAEVDIRLNELPAAEQRIKRVMALQPKSGLGHALAGDLAQARKQPDVALAAYRKAHDLDKNTASFMRVFVATIRRDRPGAVRLAEQWVATHPRDALVWRALADTQLRAGDAAGAQRSYEAMVKLGTRDADALNNLAQVLIQQKNAGALKVAEQALALAPGAPHVIGTTGWAAFKAGQNDRALQLLRNARLRDPSSADTRYYLAAVLAAMGRSGEARTELTAALAPDSGLSYRDAAQQLLGSLR